MFSPYLDSQFPSLTESSAHPPTPTLPGLQESTKLNPSRYKQKQLSVITKFPNQGLSPIIKSSQNRRSLATEVPARRNLFGEFNPSESIKNPIIDLPSPTKKSLRSLSTSSNDKGKHYLHEINTLNNKIRNLIKEQETMRDKLYVQENFIQGLQKGREVVYEVQSATIQENVSFDEAFFNVTFKPNEKWLPRSRKFPREVFSRPIKNK